MHCNINTKSDYWRQTHVTTFGGEGQTSLHLSPPGAENSSYATAAGEYKLDPQIWNVGALCDWSTFAWWMGLQTYLVFKASQNAAN